MDEQKEIFFSYAWSDEHEKGVSREKIINELYESLKKDNYPVIRDKYDLGYKGLITDFMKRIGKGSFVVVGISDKYLKSDYCMYELYEIWLDSKMNKSTFLERILPIKIEFIDLKNPTVLPIYFDHWKALQTKWETLIKDQSTNLSEEQFSRYKRIKAIAHELGALLDLFADINTLTNELISENNFQEIKKAIDIKGIIQTSTNNTSSENGMPNHALNGNNDLTELENLIDEANEESVEKVISKMTVLSKGTPLYAKYLLPLKTSFNTYKEDKLAGLPTTGQFASIMQRLGNVFSELKKALK